SFSRKALLLSSVCSCFLVEASPSAMRLIARRLSSCWRSRSLRWDSPRFFTLGDSLRPSDIPTPSTALNRFPENVQVAAVVVAQLEFREIEREIFPAHLVHGADHTALHRRPEALDGVRVNGAGNVCRPIRGIASASPRRWRRATRRWQVNMNGSVSLTVRGNFTAYASRDCSRTPR